jgi:hypothetical protein
MHDCVRPLLYEERLKSVVLSGEVEVNKVDLIAGELAPDADPLTDRPDRGERLNFELDVDFAATEVVDNGDVVSKIREVQRCGPATESVTAKYQNLHEIS